MKPIFRCFNLLSFSVFFFLTTPATTFCARGSTPPQSQTVLKEVQTIKASVTSDIMCHEISVVEYNLCDLLTRIIASDLAIPSQALRTCAAKLEHGAATLSLGELLDIFPEIVRFAYENWDAQDAERAPRPDAPPATANDAVVGKDVCDLTQVLAILSVIRKCVKELKQIVCEKFAATWTILADIKETMTEEFFDTRTILCDKFNGTFTVLAEIEQEIFDTRTILCDKFNGTFTVLANIEQEIFDTRTILCDKFNGTFTELNQIDQDIIDTRTILCNKFNGTFTVLDQIERDIFDTRTILCDKFNSTFTELESEFSEVFTALGFICEKIESITAPLACFQELPISAPTIITNPGSYCLVNDIVGTVTIAANCVTLNLNGFKFLGTEVHISTSGNTDIVIKNGSIQGSATNGIQINNATNIKIDNLTFIGNSNGIFIQTATCLQIQYSTFRGHTNSAIVAATLFNADFNTITCKNNTGPTVIDLSNGHNVNFGHVFVNNNTSPAAIAVANTCNLYFDKVTVNENLASPSFVGIQLLQTQNAQLSACTAHKNASSGSVAAISVITQSRDIVFKDCHANQNTSESTSLGFDVNNSAKVTFIDCQANNNVGTNESVGFNIILTADVTHKGCAALQNGLLGSSALTSGFSSLNAIKSIYDTCIADDNIATNTAIGFELLSTESACVLNCIAKSNQSTTDIGRGILLLDCSDGIVQDNLAARNFGPIIGVGIEVSNTGGTGVLSTGIFSNKSQAHAANFITVPGSILRVLYNRASALVVPSATPTVFDNLDIS